MALDPGIRLTLGLPVSNPLPPSWLGRRDATPGVPTWARNPVLSNKQLRALLSQIGYDKSQWDYSKIGDNNQLGRYQFDAQTLEGYGLLAPGSYEAYGNDAVNYVHCWSSGSFRHSATAYAGYLYNTTNLASFLSNTIAQEHLAYQYLSDIYRNLLRIRAVTTTDSPEVVGGMMSVGWDIGVGEAITLESQKGTGAFAWRYSGVGNGAQSFVSGKYALTVLSL